MRPPPVFLELTGPKAQTAPGTFGAAWDLYILERRLQELDRFAPVDKLEGIERTDDCRSHHQPPRRRRRCGAM